MHSEEFSSSRPRSSLNPPPFPPSLPPRYHPPRPRPRRGTQARSDSRPTCFVFFFPVCLSPSLTGSFVRLPASQPASQRVGPPSNEPSQDSRGSVYLSPVLNACLKQQKLPHSLEKKMPFSSISSPIIDTLAKGKYSRFGLVKFDTKIPRQERLTQSLAFSPARAPEAARSNLSSSITLSQTATKSLTNLSCPSALPYTSAMERSSA